MEENKTIKKKYFAAANGYDGFVSYFDKIFDSRTLERLFILKGGPGTGKNSFMRRVSDYFSSAEYETERFYCSSDPSSLDGIIIKKGGIAIAIIDGTAPHERDANIPGACETLINLGDSWDVRWLRAQRDKIFALNEEKKDAYSTAYAYLKMGKAAFEYQKNICKKSFDFKSAKIIAEEIMRNCTGADQRSESIRLTSAFCKDGDVKLKTIENISETLVGIGGKTPQVNLFMEAVVDSAREKGISLQLSPSPLDRSLFDTVYVPKEKIGIYISAENADINADDFIFSACNKDYCALSKTNEIIEISKDEAVRWFKIASDIHFRLEDIYSQAMDFSKNDITISKTIEEIEIIFDKNK